MKKILLSVILVAASLVAVNAPASAAVYDGETYEELLTDDTLHNQHSVVIRFYAAVFAREPDNSGIRFWLNQYDSGEWDPRRIADFFVTSDEFETLYGKGTTNAEFVDAVYPNVLGRQPDAGGRSFWIGYLDQGNSRAEMILLVSNAPEFIDANPLPSDGRAIPAPVDTTRFFDGFLGYNNTPFPTANDLSRATYADIHTAYLAVANATIGDGAAPTSRAPVPGGFRYTYDNSPAVTLTNPLLDASGRITHFDINGVPLVDLATFTTTALPSLGLEIFAYQYITTAGGTAIRLVIESDSGLPRETFAFDWDFNSPTAGSSKAINWAEDNVIPAGGRLDIVALYDGGGVRGGSLDVEIFFDDSGVTQVETVTLVFSP